MSIATRLKSVVDRIELRNPPYPIRLVVCKFENDDEYAVLKVIQTVPDRDSGMPQEIIPCFMVNRRELQDDYVAQLIIRNHLHWAARHEIDEAFHVDGIRAFDPHAVKSNKPASAAMEPV